MTTYRTNFLICLFCALLVSCGATKHGGDTPLTGTGQTFSSKVKSLDLGSQEIAYRICNSFRSKRNYWHAQPIIGMTANISFASTDCDGTSVDVDISSIIKGPLLSSAMVFDSLSSEDYEKEVQTDLHGDLRTVCPTVLSGTTPLEFYLDNEERIYTKFQRISDSTDRFTLIFTKVQEDGSYLSDEVITFDVLTTTTDNKLMGTVTTSTSSQVCGENKPNETTTQTLDSIL